MSAHGAGLSVPRWEARSSSLHAWWAGQFGVYSIPIKRLGSGFAPAGMLDPGLLHTQQAGQIRVYSMPIEQVGSVVGQSSGSEIPALVRPLEVEQRLSVYQS
jgi:hypothetical protein